jgi:hypothetical protein
MVLVIGLGVPSDLLLVPHFLVPLAVAAAVAAWRNWIPRERLRPLVLPAVVGGVIAVGLRPLLDRSGLVWIGAGIPHIFAEPIGPSLRRFLADLPRLAHEETWSVVAGVVWLASTGWTALRTARADGDLRDALGRWRLLSLTIALSVPASVAATLLNGRYENLYLVRHFLPAMLLPGLFSSSAVWWRAGAEHAARGRLFAVVAGVCVLAAAASEAMMLTPASLRFPYPASVRCIDALATRIGTRSGLGDYWSAKFVRELSHKGVEVNQVDQGLARFEWITNPDWFATTDGPTRQAPQYGFVIANNLPMDRIVATFGEPAERVDCAGLQVLVYGRPGDTVLRTWLTSAGG